MVGSSLIKTLAKEIGFSDCGTAQADRLTEEEYPLDAWLAEGCNAEMAYMERNRGMRRDPRLLVEGARSVISLVLAYKPDRLMEGHYKIAQYAYGEDYHERLKRMMYQLIAAIKERHPDFEARPFVDTAPISDRHWAARAGLGWIGRNNLFIHPLHGTYCFLGEIVTTSEIDNYDQPLAAKPTVTDIVEDPDRIPEPHHQPTAASSLCGNCMLCVNACPNHAIVSLKNGTYVVDARRCTSYNTIENRSPELPDHLNTRGYIFGCDICQLVCPYNKDVPPSFLLTDDRKQELESLATADEQTFRKMVKHSPINRIKHPQLLRNINKASCNKASC